MSAHPAALLNAQKPHPDAAARIAMSRPQIGIERLPARRPTNEPRESMNCKSCRKRKIKCNRLRPACEACLLFRCDCVYDAVPKKRGPKTDVLEALLKRVDGLEKKLKKQKKGDDNVDSSDGDSSDGDGSESARDEPAEAASTTATTAATTTTTTTTESVTDFRPKKGPADSAPRQMSTTDAPQEKTASTTAEPAVDRRPPPEPEPAVSVDTLLHTYFTRSHAKPFHILHEASFRQRLQQGQIPPYLLDSVCALASRYTRHPGGYQAAVQLGEAYALRARAEIDTDEPSMDCLQALLLLSLAFVASGKGKKAYMLLSNAIGMALALELHRELDVHAPIHPVEKEMRRRLFWTCYLLDRFMACGSRRPSLIDDSTVILRLPSWLPPGATVPVDGDYFQTTSSPPFRQGGGVKTSQGGSGMLIDISRILGITNRYLAAGGVKGDSHFPWHSLSNLSKIRQDLDAWAAGAQDIFSSVETLFRQPDSTVLVMSKLIYHLVHCLIYRPFLPVDLSELATGGQHQSWQIEATNMCFLHANAIAELTELGKQMPQIEWPGFVGYCICTAGTVHIHGVHYSKSLTNTSTSTTSTSTDTGGGDLGVFAASSEFLSREMQHLAEMRHAWACVQHHRLTLQGIYNAHTELVKAAGSAARYSPVFQLEDFFERYTNIGGPGGPSFHFDATNLVLADVVVDFLPDASSAVLQVLYGSGRLEPTGPEKRPSPSADPDASSPKRRKVARPATGSGVYPSAIPTGVLSDVHLRANSISATAVAHPSVLHDAEFRSSPQSNLRAPRSMHDQAPTEQQTPSFSEMFGFALTGQNGQPNQNGQNSQNGQNAQHGQNASGTSVPGSIELSGYDPMFTSMSTHPFGAPSPWAVMDGMNGMDGMDGMDTDLSATSATSRRAPHSHLAGGAARAAGLHQPSPDGGLSTDGSAGGLGTGPGAMGVEEMEEMDPFLSLLEQLAENEYAHGPDSELDFFLSGTVGAS